MPRQGRIDIVGGMYHVIGRGINRGIIFKDDYDRKEFLRRFSEAIHKTGNICYGWALMPNHFHLLLHRRKKSISEVMSKVLTGYALYFNRRHKRQGYLFQNRYKSILCQEEVYLLQLIRYIHLNPIRAKMIKDITMLSNYAWTGYSALLGVYKRDFQDIDEILERFGKSRNEAAKKIKIFMEEGLKQGKREDLIGGGLRRSAGGWSRVLEMKRSKEYWRGDDRILGEGSFVDDVLAEAEALLDKKERNQRQGYTCEYAEDKVCKYYKIEKKYLIKKRCKGNVSNAKSVLVYICQEELGISGKELSERLGCTAAAISLLKSKGAEIVDKNKLNLIT